MKKSGQSIVPSIIDALVVVENDLIFVPILMITGLNLQLCLCMWCNKCRNKLTKAKSNIWYKKSSGINKTKTKRLVPKLENMTKNSLKRLNKGFDLNDFSNYVSLSYRGIHMRVW